MSAAAPAEPLLRRADPLGRARQMSDAPKEEKAIAAASSFGDSSSSSESDEEEEAVMTLVHQHSMRRATLMGRALHEVMALAEAEDNEGSGEEDIHSPEPADSPPDDADHHHHHHHVSWPRLLDRKGPSRQSLGHLRVRAINRPQEVFFEDLYHSIVDMRTQRILAMCFLLYTLVFLFFAWVFWIFGHRCNIGCERFVDAMFLSIETMTTIGYGVPDPFFRECPWLMPFMLAQVFFTIVFDAALAAMLYQRISRGSTRASTILFSDKATLRTMGGQTYFMFQMCEMRRTQLTECHVRCYAFTRKRPTEDSHARTSVEQQLMRMEQPDDSMGSPVLLSLPINGVHRIDAWSPLRGLQPHVVSPWGASLPSDTRDANDDTGDDFDDGDDDPCLAMTRHLDMTSPQRSSDCDSGGRDSLWCRACGESFSLDAQYRRHVEIASRNPQDTAHTEIQQTLSRPNVLTTTHPSKCQVPPELSRKEIKKHLRSSCLEVIVLLEGIDAKTSASVQARHSYTVDDMVWDHTFAQCVYRCGEKGLSGGVLLDFKDFHTVVPLPELRPSVG